MIGFLQSHTLDILTTCLGLLYIFLEYRVNIWLWIVGFIMPVLDIVLYWSHGLYGDAGMAVYYALAALWGVFAWWRSRHDDGKQPSPSKLPTKNNIPRHLPAKLYVPTAVALLVIWAATWFVLSHYTASTVPVLDAFTNALSIVALWALSRKYIEQWVFWIVVDGICCYLYVIKGIPFKALLYGLYVAIAIAGWRKWNKMEKEQSPVPNL